MTNVETVREIYEAFGGGDVPAILDRMADDVSGRRVQTTMRSAPVYPGCCPGTGQPE